MRKFCIVYEKESASVVEVECEIIKGVEDPSVMWLPPGEFRARVLAPQFLYEKKKDSKELIPPVWYTHAFYDSLELAMAQVETDIRTGFERAIAKHKIEFYSEDDVKQKLSEVKVIMP